MSFDRKPAQGARTPAPTPDAGAAPRVAIALAALNIPVMAFAHAQTATSHPRERLHEVVVSAKRMYYNGANELALDKLTQSLVDTPQTIAAVSAKDLSDRAVNDLNGALRAVPGITLGAGESNWQGNNPYLRGFPARDDLFVDGQRDFGSYYRDPFDDEQVVVLEGPASILFGHGSTGGVINQVSKSPRLTPLFAGTATLGTDDLQRVTVDTGAPLAQIGAGAAFRLNLMANHSGVADRDVVHADRRGVAPSLAMGLGTPTRLEIKYFHQTGREVPDLGIPWLNVRPAPVRRANFYGFADDYLDTTVDMLTARLEHDLGGSTTLNTQLRYSTDTRRYRMTEADLPKGLAPNTPIGAITVARNAFPAFQGSGASSFLDDQTDLTMHLSAGPVRHAVVTGFELGREAPHTTYYNDVGVPGTNLASPTLQPYSVAVSYPEMSTHTVAKTVAVYALDTLEWGNWQVMGGGREDLFDAPYDSVKYSPTGAVIARTSADQVNRIFSYRAALVYKPTPGSSVYAMTGTSFDPSAEGIASLISAGRALAQANLSLDPEKTKTYEVGAKWRPSNERLLVTGALFRMEMTNARVPDPTNPELDVLGGDERVDGAQLSVSGHLTRALKIEASYTHLDSVVVRTTPKGPLLGAPLTNAPRNSSSVWFKYRISRPVQIGIGALQASSQLGQDTAAAYLVAPGYVVWNAMAKYRVSQHLVAQLNLNNVANRYYIAQVHPFHVIPAEGFAALLSVAVRY